MTILGYLQKLFSFILFLIVFHLVKFYHIILLMSEFSLYEDEFEAFLKLFYLAPVTLYPTNLSVFSALFIFKKFFITFIKIFS